MVCIECNSDKFFGREVIVASGVPSAKWQRILWCSQCDVDTIVAALPEAYKCTLCGWVHSTREMSLECCRDHVTAKSRAFPEFRPAPSTPNIKDITQKAAMQSERRAQATENGRAAARRWNKTDAIEVIQERIAKEKKDSDGN